MSWQCKAITVLFMVAVASSAQAQATKRAKAPTSGLDGESKKIRVGSSDGKKVKYAEKTDINFDDALVEGTHKSPFASMLSTRDQDFGKGFIKIRREWHDQLIMSVSGLSQ